MKGYQVLTVPQDVAGQVRETMVAPGWGHPAYAEVATGYGPCRVCLHTFEEGNEERILFTYDPFEGVEPFPLPGPIYVHRAPCEAYRKDAGFPEDLRHLPLTINGYARGRMLRAQERVADGRVEDVIDRLLSRPDIDYLHVRNTEAGCFIFQIERRAEDRSHPGSETDAVSRY